MTWHWIRVALWVLLLPHCLAASASDTAPASTALVLGTPSLDHTFAGSYVRRIYLELARRTGVPIEVITLPLARLTLEVANDKLDGDTGRARVFAQSQPQLLRVDEPVMEIQLALWATNPKVRLTRLEDLAATPYDVSYTRGTLLCENALKPLLLAERLHDVSGTVQAVEMMHYGRNALYCGIDINVISETKEALPNKSPPLRVLNIGKPTPIYLFLQPRHAALVEPFQQALRRLRQDGTLERVRRETLKEYNIPLSAF